MSELSADELRGRRALLEQLFRAAVSAGQARGRLASFLPEPPAGRTVVVGAGKAAGAMAAELDAVWKSDLRGAVVTRDGYAPPDYAGRIEVLEAGHPVPDERGRLAARRMFELVSGLEPQDLVLALLSGGASALLVGTPEGIALAEKQALCRSLLSSGAAIHEMNVVRKHISSVKGGRLACAAHPAQILTLAISDVPGDDIADIGSGPTTADPTTCEDALSILDRYRIVAPDAIRRHLEGGQGETPKPGDPRLARASHRIIARPRDALDAAAAAARAAGFEPVILGDALQGEARELAAAHAALALELKARGRRGCLLSGGETTVTVNGRGRGGRNSEYLLALAIALDGAKEVFALAADTDGVDGSEANAGAVAFPSTLARARQRGLDAQAFLENNDAYSFFEATDELVVTGPTFTNVNDFRAILVAPSP